MSEDAEELKELIEEFVIAIKLSQFKNVSSLSFKICQKLIDYLDGELLDKSEEDEIEGITADELISLVGVICDEFRKKGLLASTYLDVVDFVSKQDLYCLAKLLGAIESGRKNEGQNELERPNFELENLSSVLRKSIFLLKCINDDSSLSMKQEAFCLDASLLERIESVGFPVYKVELESKPPKEEASLSIESVSSRLKSLKQELELEPTSKPDILNNLLLTDWFCVHFLDPFLASSFPLDRMIILVAVWIISDYCKHVSCQQVIGELVDQIYHEEVSTSNREQLMQLTQTGSFWLSYHKRFRASFNKQQVAEFVEQEDEEEEEEEEDQLGEEDGTEEMLERQDDLFNLSDGMGNGSDTQLESKNVARHRERLEADRKELRRTIDEKLLYGSECLACGYKPSSSVVLLEPLSSKFCSNCNENLSHQSLTTAISCQELRVLNLSPIMNRLERCFFLTPNEWASQLIEFSGLERLGRGLSSPTPSSESHLVSSANFDRLRVSRPPGSEEERDSEADNSSLSSESEHSDDDSENYLLLLKRFIKRRQVISGKLESRQGNSAKLSESLQLIRSTFGEDVRKIAGGSMAFCSSDILLTEELFTEGSSSMEILLIGRKDWLSKGFLWCCQRRSATSGLKVGCGRLFNSMELSRFVQTGEMAPKAEQQFVCPYCRSEELTKVKSLYEKLRDH